MVLARLGLTDFRSSEGLLAFDQNHRSAAITDEQFEGRVGFNDSEPPGQSSKSSKLVCIQTPEWFSRWPICSALATHSWLSFRLDGISSGSSIRPLLEREHDPASTLAR